VAANEPLAAVFECPGVGSVQLQLPCALGEAPVSEVECASDHGTINFFAASLTPSGSTVDAPPLGRPLDFHAVLTPSTATLSTTPKTFRLTALSGTVELSAFSFAQQSVEGRFVTAQTTWTAGDGATLTCTLADAPLRAVPGHFE